ncbi:NAD-dependent succinate-semialdehyde dehydrogenase [Ornithinimicrobium sufpigmenti]|uniref:NAD-dependent succinate-semialdehyde dehydrogenase n=1 Tax=Ornithinimicrobium sufpigmenti TaxID=2508882 RepID=UPI001EDEA88D|nr:MULTISPECIES: NAD-dependent succinate-semialdehyde dehydrogenase [unclassified Ornithinimicrobium]
MFQMATATSTPTHHSIIGGAHVEGEGGTRAVIDPSREVPIAEVSLASIDQCRASVDTAARAQSDWAALPSRARSEILSRAYNLMVRDQEKLAELISMENGKALSDARGEAAYAAEFFRWFAEEAVRVRGDLRPSPSGHNWIAVSHEPIGVALLITPWNFPAAMATRKIAPALAAGCSVILKPATETPLAALFVAELLAEAGVPDGVVNVIVTSPAGPAVAAMLADRRVRAVSFTGSTEVGMVLLREAAGNVAKPSMELGGNAPFIVLDDADLDEAVEGFMLAKFRNGGSACTAANRIFVQSGVADEFVERITRRVEQLKVGPGLKDGTDIGAMVSRTERDRVAELVDQAVAEGATIRTGGTIPDGEGFFYTPTVLENVRPDSTIAQTEIFGPVAPIIRFDNVDEALAWANNTDAGLVAYVYTQGLTSGLVVSRRLEAGMVGLNRGLVSDPGAPFGGSKHSGLGREGSHDGILEFMETKYLATPYV